MITEEFYSNCELYKRGLFDYISWKDKGTGEILRYHKKQIQALEYFNDDMVTYVGFGGAARGGKSLLIASSALFETHCYPESRYLIGRKNLTTLWQTTWKTLIKTMNNFGFQDRVDYSYNGQKHELIFFENKSEIIAKNLERKPSDEEATEFGSLEITKAYIDQSEHVDLKIVEKVGERVGTHQAVRYNIKGKVMEAFNPAKTHVNRRYWLPFRDKKEKQTRKFVRALPTDNPGEEAIRWVEEKEKEFKDGTMSKVEYQKQVKGNFDYDDDPSALIDYDSIKDYFNGKHVTETNETYLTIDVARKGKDKTIYRVWKGWICVKRIEEKKSRIDLIVRKAQELQAKYGIPNSRTIADEDGVGGGVVDMLGCNGFINNSRPLKELIGNEYILPNYNNLKTQCSILMAKKIVAKQVVEHCDNNEVIELVSEEMEQVKMKDIDKDGKLQIQPKDKVKEMLGRSPDDWDSIMMRYWFELEPEEYEIY